jgi:hypothetical protein
MKCLTYQEARRDVVSGVSFDDELKQMSERILDIRRDSETIDLLKLEHEYAILKRASSVASRATRAYFLTFDERLDNFWSQVNATEISDCWDWVGARDKCGYGIFPFVPDVDGLPRRYGTRAHRFAYLITGNPINTGMMVCHSCDHPPCCNPSHLFAGTNTDNMRDASIKGRMNPPKGEKRWNAKITERDVIAIRHLASSGEMQKDIAVKFGLSASTIANIVRRHKWRHVA